MLGKIAIFGTLIIGVYTKDAQIWNLFYVLIGIAVLRFLFNFTTHRLKYSKLVSCPRKCTGVMKTAGSTTLLSLGSP